MNTYNFFDYKLIKHDYLSNKEIINFAYDFPPGNHQILIIYKYFRESDYYNKPMKLYVRSLELINIKESSIECIKEDIKGDIFKCENNYFYNENTKKCEKCKEGEYFLHGFNIKESKCVPKKKCSKYDKVINYITKCDLGYSNKTIVYKYISSDFCFFVKWYKFFDIKRNY